MKISHANRGSFSGVGAAPFRGRLSGRVSTQRDAMLLGEPHSLHRLVNQLERQYQWMLWLMKASGEMAVQMRLHVLYFCLW